MNNKKRYGDVKKIKFENDKERKRYFAIREYYKKKKQNPVIKVDNKK